MKIYFVILIGGIILTLTSAYAGNINLAPIETCEDRLNYAHEKERYKGPKNIPDPQVILQGGDTFLDALVIPSVPYCTSGTTSGYTDDYDEACPYSGSSSPDVVYVYTPPWSMTIPISLCGGSEYDTKFYIYEESYTPGNPLYCNDDLCPDYLSEIIEVELQANTTYYIVVDGYGGDYGQYTIDVGNWWM